MTYTDSMSESIRNSAVLPEADLYLFGRGEARRAYLVFGCHEIAPDENGIAQFMFALWAPHAKSVHIVGDFNNWDEYARTSTPSRAPMARCS